VGFEIARTAKSEVVNKGYPTEAPVAKKIEPVNPCRDTYSSIQNRKVLLVTTVARGNLVSGMTFQVIECQAFNIGVNGDLFTGICP